MAKSLNLLLTLLFTYPAYSCIIHGTDSGYCDFRYHAQYYEGTQSQLVKTQKMENDFGRVIARNFQTEAHNFWGGPMKNGGECTSELGHGLNIEALTADIRSPRQEVSLTQSPLAFWKTRTLAMKCAKWLQTATSTTTTKLTHPICLAGSFARLSLKMRLASLGAARNCSPGHRLGQLPDG